MHLARMIRPQEDGPQQSKAASTEGREPNDRNGPEQAERFSSISLSQYKMSREWPKNEDEEVAKKRTIKKKTKKKKERKTRANGHK